MLQEYNLRRLASELWTNNGVPSLGNKKTTTKKSDCSWNIAGPFKAFAEGQQFSHFLFPWSQAQNANNRSQAMHKYISAQINKSVICFRCAIELMPEVKETFKSERQKTRWVLPVLESASWAV